MITQEIKERVQKHYKSGFSSSPVELSDDSLAVLSKSDYRCDCCGIPIFEMYDFPCINDNQEGVLCEDCDNEKYYSTCPICENYYLSHKKAEETVFVISSETVKEYGLSAKPGLYKVLRFPVYYGDCLSGFDDLFYNNIELVKECDINSMLNKIYPHAKHEVNMDDICNECFDKYTGKTKLLNNYSNKKHGKKVIAITKKAIKEGN